MKSEVFDLDVNYKDQNVKVRVKADLPVGPEPLGSDYKVYMEGKHVYTLNHCKNEDDRYCWEIKKKSSTNHDEGLAQAIGKTIDKHYS